MASDPPDATVVPGPAAKGPEPAGPRVKIVQAEARRALVMAGVFMVTAGLAVVVPHHTGAWLPLHLFLVGAVLLAISGATRLFAVTWSAGDPRHPRVVVTQRWLVAVGAAGLAVGRELSLPGAVLAVAGSCVTVALVLLGYLLITDVRHARVRRFQPALRYYLAAVGAGIVGTALGAAMVTGRTGLRDAHVIVNLLGLVGLVIAGTLPFFTATQARTKMSPRATPARLLANLGVLAATVAVAAGAALTEHTMLEGAALAGYAGGILHLATALPVPSAKQLRWAGPRLAQLAIGVAWWVGAVAVAGGRAVAGDVAFDEHLVVALVLGGYVQILIASLAYLGPVLRGGGHQQLTAGFAATRSWTAVAFANLAGIAWLVHQPHVVVVAVVIVVVEVMARSWLLARHRVTAVSSGT